MRSILFLNTAMRLKRGNGDSFSDVFCCVISHLFHLEFQRPQKCLKRGSGTKFCSQSQRSYYEQTSLIMSSTNESLYNSILLSSKLINDSFVSFISPKTLISRLADEFWDLRHITEMFHCTFIDLCIIYLSENKLTRFKAKKS